MSFIICFKSYSDDYKKLEIEGIKIGDNIFDIVKDETVLEGLKRFENAKIKPYKGKTDFILLNFYINEIKDQSKVLNNFDFVRVHYKKKDNIIHQISGGIHFGKETMSNCINQLNAYKFKFDVMFTNAKRIETKIVPQNNYPGTNVKEVYYGLPGGMVRLICYDKSLYENYEGDPNARIRLDVQASTKEFIDFVNLNQ